MLTSETDIIDGVRIVRSIGTIRVVSTCHAVGRRGTSTTWRDRMLAELVRRAEDFDADAIVRIDFRTESLGCDDEVGIPMERICAEGVAVRLAA